MICLQWSLTRVSWITGITGQTFSAEISGGIAMMTKVRTLSGELNAGLLMLSHSYVSQGSSGTESVHAVLRQAVLGVCATYDKTSQYLEWHIQRRRFDSLRDTHDHGCSSA
jgi:hypothetical protein